MNYSTYSLSELKALALELNAIPTSDKRSKQAWIDIIILARECAVLRQASPQTEEEFEQISSAYDSRAEVLNEMLTEPDSEDIFGGFGHVSVINYGDMPETPAQQEAVASISNKKGAATVFASLLCILILTIQAVLCIGCIIVQAAIHLKNLFGSYNPDYDLFGQLQDMVRQRKSIVSAQQAQQPAYW